MSRLLLYNPENDLALASNALSYTPTMAAKAMRQSGVLLPLWWSEAGDEVLMPTDLIPQAESLCQKWNLLGKPVSVTTADCAMPWGWSRSTKRELQSLGIKNLPTDEQVQTIRNLSHRRTSIDLLKMLGTDKNMQPKEFDNVDAALSAIDNMGDTVLKMPWSGSGRGVFHSNHISRTMLEKTVQDVINRQGSIILEHELRKKRDFATLYYSDGKSVTYRGLSLFITDNHGHYQGNHLMPQPLLTENLGVDITELAERVAKHLTSIIAPHYQGWLGVDMMLYYDHNGNTAIWPCIEINLRLTMGVLALYCTKHINTTGKLLVTKQPVSTECINLSPASSPIHYVIIIDK